MIWLQVLFLLFVSGSLGLLLLELIKYKTENLFEYIVISFGIGLSLFMVLNSIFDIFSIPIFWLYHLILIVIALVIFLYFKRKHFISRFKKLNKQVRIFDILVILLFLIQLFVFANASLNQPALENDDPWGVALNTARVSDYKTYDTEIYVSTSQHPWKDGRSEPYAQGYHMILGTLNQISESIPQTLKFFNSLFVSLSLLFVYFFVYKLFSSKAIAFLASFSLFANPSFLSRFIWAEALAVSLLLLLLYFTCQKDRSSKILAGIVWGSIAMLHQRTFLVSVVVMLSYYFVVLILELKERLKTKNFSIKDLKLSVFNKVFYIGVVGFFTAIIYWGWQLTKFGFSGILERDGGFSNPYWSRAIISFSDYFTTKSANDMANPSGVGIVMIIVALLGILFVLLNKKLNKEYKVLLPTLLAVLLVLHQFGRFAPSPIPIITVWKFIAIPTAIFFAYGLVKLKDAFFKKNLGIYVVFLIIVILGVLVNSAYPKYQVTTSTWPTGIMWVGGAETLKPYLYLQNIESDAKVFSNANTRKLVGMGFNAEYANGAHEEFKDDIYNKTGLEIYQFLKDNNYEYLIVEIEIMKHEGQERGGALLNELLTKLSQVQMIRNVGSSQTAFLFKVI